MARLTPPDTRIQFGDTIEDTVVPDSIVRSRSSLKPVRRKLDVMYGESKWGDNEVRLYVAQTEWRKKLIWEAASAAGLPEASVPSSKPTTAPKPPTAPTPEAEIEAQVQRIMETHPDLAETNRDMVRQRGYYNRSLKQLALNYLAALESEDKSGARQIQQQMIDIQKEVRQIDKDLRLDAGSLRSGGKEEIREEVIKVMDRSKALLDKNAIRIVCPACRAGKQEVHINLGWILYHFRQDDNWHFFCVCPHPDCRQGIHIEGGPGRETTITNTPKDVGPLRR